MIEEMDIQSIAVLGAGSSGLAVAKYLLAEKKFSKIDIYEQRAATGGVWNASRADHEPNFTIPRTTPTNDHEYAVVPDRHTVAAGLSPHVEFVSPVYDQLETNIPFSLMNYSDFEFPADTALFPEHQTVLEYLQQYGRAVEPLIIFETQVQDVCRVTTGQDGLKSKWKVESKSLKSGIVSSHFYDAVVVASGHYSDPFVPNIPGITEFDAAHPGVIMHSKFYRRPEQFSGKKVIVVGNSASGLDISSQIATTSQLPVLVSEKAVSEAAAAVPPSSSSTSWSRHIGEITKLVPHGRAVHLSTGAVEQDVDAIIFCTGYLYSFPFLRNLNPTVITPDGTYTDHLWQHLLYSKDPSLAFLTIPKRIVPFPLAEAQSAVVARMWAGRVPMPTATELSAWVAKRAAETSPALRHTLSYPQDRDYINNLYALSQQAKRDGTLRLENDGAGKTPPYWDQETSWVRSNIFHIKVASRALGDRRKDCKTLADLGFDYEVSQTENGIA